MVRLVIFDFDGVIITGSNQGYFTCYHNALEAVNIYLKPDEERKRIIEIWGKGYKYQLEYLLKEHSSLLPKAIKAYEACYYSPVFSKNIRLVKGADVALGKLAKEYRLAIASGMMRKTLDIFLQKFNIENFFKIIVTSDEITKPKDKKPSPFMLNKIIKCLRIDKRQAVYLGDAASDVAMARNAGILPIVVLTGHLTKKQAEDLNVKHILPNITNLQEVLQ